MTPDPTKPLILAPWSGRPIPVMIDVIGELRFKHGWGWTQWGGTQIHKVRSILANEALQLSAHDWWFWIDNDNAHSPERIIQLWEDAKAHDFDFLSAVVPCRMRRPDPNFVGDYEANGGVISMGAEGGFHQARRAGLAMAFTHRRLFEHLAREGMLRQHTCSQCGHVDRVPLPTVSYKVGYNLNVRLDGKPFFHPELVDDPEDGGTHEVGEDYILCDRARELGHKLWVDTRMVAHHETVAALTFDDLLKTQRENESYARRRAEEALPWA